MSLKGTYRNRIEEVARMVLTVCGHDDDYKRTEFPQDGFVVSDVRAEIKHFFNDLIEYQHIKHLALTYPSVFTILDEQNRCIDRMRRFVINWSNADLFIEME